MMPDAMENVKADELDAAKVVTWPDCPMAERLVMV